jgi:hypothetical protein
MTDNIIETTKGNMLESLLEKRTGKEEDENQILTWIEYWFEGELVHRSVDLYLKRGIDFGLDAASLV